MSRISPSEKQYITAGVESGIRADARSRTDIREIVLEVGMILQSSGSARCQIDNTDVLVGIKVEVGDIAPEFSGDEAVEQADDENTGRADRGRVVCSVDW
jgi:exosome complex RNA-binding protein Rrp42 (RNase PH superfamily)